MARRARAPRHRFYPSIHFLASAGQFGRRVQKGKRMNGTQRTAPHHQVSKHMEMAHLLRHVKLVRPRGRSSSWWARYQLVFVIFRWTAASKECGYQMNRMGWPFCPCLCVSPCHPIFTLLQYKSNQPLPNLILLYFTWPCLGGMCHKWWLLSLPWPGKVVEVVSTSVNWINIWRQYLPSIRIQATKTQSLMARNNKMKICKNNIILKVNVITRDWQVIIRGARNFFIRFVFFNNSKLTSKIF